MGVETGMDSKELPEIFYIPKHRNNEPIYLYNRPGSKPTEKIDIFPLMALISYEL